MNDLICSHCTEIVPQGATVCRGCQAEVEYGSPKIAHVILLVVSVALGFKTADIVPASLSFLSWVVGIATFIGGSVLLSKVFSNRVVFKRIYKTK